MNKSDQIELDNCTGRIFINHRRRLELKVEIEDLEKEAKELRKKIKQKKAEQENLDHGN